jgi:hypothetical protein
MSLDPKIYTLPRAVRDRLVAQIYQTAFPRADAQESVLFSRQLEQVQAELVRDEFPQYVNRRAVPVAGGVARGARTYTWRRMTPVGAAKMLSNYATDFPNVSVVGTEYTTPIRDGGGMWLSSLQDMEAGDMAGVSLDAENARTALESIEQLRERTQLRGDATLGIPGFLNDSSVPLVTTGYTGNWDAGATTGAQIIQDVRRFQAVIQEQSQERHPPPYVMMISPAIATQMRTKNASIYESMSVMDYLRERDGIEFVITPECALADAGSDGPRMVLYRRDPSVVRQIAPVDYEELAPQLQGFSMEHYFRARFGGSVWQRPLAGLYIDGILDGAN